MKSMAISIFTQHWDGEIFQNFTRTVYLNLDNPRKAPNMNDPMKSLSTLKCEPFSNPQTGTFSTVWTDYGTYLIITNL